jgi:type VI protein secretion system component VasF
MVRTANGEKAKRLTPKTRTAVVTILWIVVVCVAMAFIAFAAHI